MQHSFDVAEATKYGIEKAVILNNLRFWLEKNKANNINSGDGYYWTYNSASAYAKLFPYLTAKSISRYLLEMEKEGLVISSFRSENKLNRTKSYSMPEYATTPVQPISQNEKSTPQNEEWTSQNRTMFTDINSTDINKDKEIKDTSVSAKQDLIVQEIFDHWKLTMNSPRSKLDNKRIGLITKALTNYTSADLKLAITGNASSEFNMGKNDRGTKYNGLDLILRDADHIDKYIAMAENPVSSSVTDWHKDLGL